MQNDYVWDMSSCYENGLIRDRYEDRTSFEGDPRALYKIESSMQNRRPSIAKELELRPFCVKLSIWCLMVRM